MVRRVRPMVMWAGCAWLLGAAGLCHARGGDGAGGEPEAPSTPGAGVEFEKRKVAHLKLAGDLDHARLVRQFGDELAQFKREGAELFVLELSGDRWRSDIVAEMIRAAAAAGIGVRSGGGGGTDGGAMGVPWIVWLNDPADSRVGTGQAALAAVADRCYIGPKTEVVFDPGQDERELAPPETPTQPGVNWAQVEQDVQAAVWSRLNARGCEVLLASALPTPRQVLWITPAPRAPGQEPGAATLKLVAQAPDSQGAGAMMLVSPATGAVGSGRAEVGAMRLRMDASAAVGLGLAAGQARELGQILAARRIAPRPLVRRELHSDLPAAKERLSKDLGEIDAARERMDKVLDAAERLLRKPEAVKRRSQAGTEALALADEAMRKLLGAEALTAEYPELLRGVPPGQTRVGLTDAKLTLAWTSAFQTRREELTELRNRAARLVE
jgi:hypothetical protein